MRWFTDKWTLENIAALHKRHAAAGVYNGDGDSLANKVLMADCTSGHIPSGSIVLFTRDKGMHDCGWWKNPDYNQCLHLSLSFRDPATGKYRSKDQEMTDKWLEVFYGPLQRLMWAERPYYPEGKQADCWHYRVFFDPTWSAPILPRGEVYSKKWTPANWMSHSELMASLGRQCEAIGSGVAESQ